MADVKAQLKTALKDAMKSKDNQRRDVIRLVQSAIKQQEVDSGEMLNDDQTMDILQKEAKKRRESITDYEKAGRDDLAEAERQELAIIETFLPRQLSKAEIEQIVEEVIAETGASSPQEMGKVMGPVMARVQGQADGKLVNQVVQEKLNS
jgi:uncharacterized protein